MAIQVKLNPDITPAGSDLSVVNAARRSFNQRSGWEKLSLSHQELEESGDKYNDWQEYDSFYEPYVGYGLRKLKDKDKRLIEFLARGMTADDFEEFLTSVHRDACWADVYDAEHMYDDDYEGLDFSDLKEKLWQWRNTPTHDTPFNHTFISFEVKAPIFVARQLVKHEYLIFSEFSRRYKTDDIEFYEPDYWRKAAPDKKQGSSDEIVEGSEKWKVNNDPILDDYKGLLERGVAPEQARMVLPQSLMTEWTWSGTLGAFAKMCRERLGKDAQYETRIVAQQVYDYLKEYYPVSAKALVEGPDV